MKEGVRLDIWLAVGYRGVLFSNMSNISHFPVVKNHTYRVSTYTKNAQTPRETTNYGYFFHLPACLAPSFFTSVNHFSNVYTYLLLQQFTFWSTTVPQYGFVIL